MEEIDFFKQLLQLLCLWKNRESSIVNKLKVKS